MHYSLMSVNRSYERSAEINRFISNFQDQIGSGAIIILDVDDFIFFNNFFGYHMGDMLIQQIFEFLRSAVRKEQIFQHDGGKFVVLIKNRTKQYANNITKQIFQRFASPFIIEGKPYSCTVSIGLVYYPEHAQTVEQMISTLDFALYDAKSSGKNRIAVFNQSNVETIKRKYKIEWILKRAVLQNEFKIYYQPIYDVKTNRFTKSEALLRLFHKDISISPAEFIPIAERIGLISEIGYFVIEQVFRDIGWIRQRNIPFESISINISIMQFFDPYFIPKLTELIQKYDIATNMIEFEILESVLITSFDQIRDVIDQITALGIQLSIDDFGTGFSSLSYALNLPIATLKLDKCISGQLNPQNRILIKHLVLMAHEMGIRVVAEGIEHAHQIPFLKSCGCDYVQGFLFSKPVPLSEAAAFLGQSPV